MATQVQVTIELDLKPFEEHLEDIVKDESLMTAIHNALARYCDPYVPFLEGILATSTEITADGVKYTQPYSRYMYFGEIYGPNIPVRSEDGTIVGWFSPKGKKKHPTGRQMKYTTDYHPLATAKWDKVMLQDKGDAFTAELSELIAHRWEELYGGNG